MNREKVWALAREAGIDSYGANHWTFRVRVEKFAMMLEAEVREECAQVCDRQMDIEEINPAMAVAAGNCADAIRFGEAEG